EDALELALSVAASLLWDRVRRGEPAALITNARPWGDSMGPLVGEARTEAAFQRLLEGMASLRWEDPATWESVLVRAGGPPPGFTTVVVSPGPLAAQLLSYARRWDAWVAVPERRAMAPGP